MRTHGLRATYTDGCRCGPCTAANTRYFNARRQRGQVPPGGAHGASGYDNYGCRCLACTYAKQVENARNNVRRRRAAGRPVTTWQMELTAASP